jgi:hypothetical protein
MENGIEKAALSLEPYSWMHAHRIWSIQMPRVARELHLHDLLETAQMLQCQVVYTKSDEGAGHPRITSH